MSDKNLGIDELVDVAVDALEIAKEVKEATDDGIQPMDGLVVVNNFPRIKRIGAKAKTAWEQLQDLKGAEAEQAAMEISVRTHLPNDASLFGKVGKALRLSARSYRHYEETVDLVNDWKELFQEAA